MQIYLVGGAVRDGLLGYPVTERDWVVTGATPDHMLAQGYEQVGKDFPVFLHPKTKDEYALARTERKQGSGYTGFVCDSDSSISLEQDLLRRDLTVNAMAMDDDGQLIDPYQGAQDLERRVLRHVSDAFVEDPLRVLRVARFAARYHHLGFSIAPETLALMSNISQSGELTALTPERVWKETARSLLDPRPDVYIEVLRQCGALSQILPELDALWGVPNPANWHPEIDTGIHTTMVLQQACGLSTALSVRFAAMVHDLGKALTPKAAWPSHRGHEKLGVTVIEKLCQRLKVNNECRDLACIMSLHHSLVHRINSVDTSEILAMFNHADAWRKEQRFHLFLLCCEADARGRKGLESHDYPQRQQVEHYLAAAKAIDVQKIIADGHKGPQIKQQLNEQRTAVIDALRNKHNAAQ